MNLGETFIPSGTLRANHLHIVISQPVEGAVAVVNLTTKRWDSDTCCLLTAGSHRRVVRETVALYNQALLIPVEKLAAGLEAKVLTADENVATDVLRQLQDGALECEQTPPDVVTAVRATLGV